MNPAAVALNQHGLELGNRGRFAEALAAFDKALELEPSFALARNNQGWTLGSLGRFAEALVAVNQALELDPTLVLAWSNKGWVHYNLRQWDEALTAFDRALAIDKTHALAWKNKFNLLQQLGRNPEAADTAFVVGNALVEQDQFVEALEAYQATLQLAPNHNAAWNNQGWSHDNLKQWDEALTAYDRALELENTDPYAWKNKVELLRRLGRSVDAAVTASAVGYALDEQGKYAEALEAYQRALELNPNHAPAWNNKGWVHENLKQWDEALAAYDHALELNPTYSHAWRNKVDLLRRLGRATEAAITAVTASHHLYQQDQYTEALEACEQALQLDPRNAMAWNNKGVCLHKLSQAEEARKALEQALAIDPRHPLAHDNLAALFPPAPMPVPKPERPLPPPAPNLPAPPAPVPKPSAPPAPVPPPASASSAQPDLAPVPTKSEPRHKIFIDTCSLMYPQAEAFFRHWIEPRARQPQVRVLVPVSVAHEIQKHLDGTDENARRKAEQAAPILKTYVQQGLVEWVDDQDRRFADNVFLTLFQHFCLQYDLTLVTQDGNLAQDVLDIKKRRSVQVRKRISAVRIARDGAAHPWRDATESRLQERNVPRNPAQKKSTPAFQLRSGVARIDAAPLPLTRPAAEGDLLFTARQKPLHLGKTLGRGGEGTVFLTDTDQVCKTYGPKPPTRAKREKLERMCAHPLQYPGLCWPLELVFNEWGEFAGYLMPQAGGHELQHSVMHPKLLEETFPEWNRLQLVRLAITILETISHLHKNNVLLGDLNPSNILVEDETTVYFVDGDSFQIEEFPCPVGKVPFVHPDLMGQDFGHLLRTLEHEHFAVATLVFMLLMPGKPPYSHQGGESLNVNVLKGHFPYPLGEKRGAGVPQGPWRFIWSHLPKYVKQDLHDYFTSQAQKNTHDWLKLLHRYLGDLESGRLREGGLELFPKSYKSLSKEAVLRKGGTWQTCKSGGHEYGILPGEKEKDLGYCSTCLIKRIVVPCARCKAVIRTQLRNYIVRGKKRLLCEKCKDAIRVKP